MDRAGDEFLTRARFTLDQHARIGLRHQIDLLEHTRQRGAATNNVSKIARFDDLFTQVVPFQFQLAAELVDLLERAAKSDGRPNRSSDCQNQLGSRGMN